MISPRVVQRVGLPLVFRVAWRSAPMMGIDRFILSHHTILFLFVLLGTPLAARSATLDDSARELARKIAASVPLAEGVSVEVRNLSSSTPDEFAGVQQALKEELENLKVHVVTSGAAAVSLKITLSENMRGLLLSAEITHGGASQVILMAVSHTSEFRIASYLMPIVLHSQIIWEGPEQILDAAVASDVGGLTLFVLLLPDALEIQQTRGITMTTVKIPSAGIAARNPRGRFEIAGSVALAIFQSRTCTFNLSTHELVECHTPVSTDLSREGGLTDEVPHDLLSPEKGSEMLMPQNGCDAALATGSGDFTQPDSVQAFSVKPAGVAISNKLDFPGPVLALRGGSGASRAIVRNLKTGNYEAYSLSCGK